MTTIKAWKNRVAGVTFRNEGTQGGRSRQEILKELPEIITVDLKKTTYDGQPAVMVLEHRTKQQIGWLPKNTVKDADKRRQVTGFIHTDKRGRRSVELSDQQAPSTEVYRYAKKLCQEKGIEMPAYDMRAYGRMFAMIKAEN